VGEFIPQKKGRTSPIPVRVSSVERKLWEAECEELGSNGKPLDMSKLIRGCMAEHFARKEAARKKPLDMRAYEWVKKWWQGQ